jgi:hypothetical protein
MSNVNTSAGYLNLPAQSITTTTQTALLVPAQGLYSTLPSPVLPVGVGLYSGFAPDIASNGTVDGHKFTVRVEGKVFTGASSLFTVALFQVPAAIAAANTQATLANDASVATGISVAGITGAASFVLETEFMWDSTSLKLTGYSNVLLINGVVTAINGGTLGITTATPTAAITTTSGNDLKFLPTFTFATANAANTVTVTEFSIDRA